MAGSNFVRILKLKAEGIINDRAMSLARGEAIDYGAYRQSVGFVEGVEAIIHTAEDMEKERG